MTTDLEAQTHDRQEPQTLPVQRTWRAALLRALPAIALISLMMWSAVGVIGLLLGSFINAEATGFIIAAVLLGPVAFWANRHIIRLAVAAER
jgi:hypothetical protein